MCQISLTGHFCPQTLNSPNYNLKRKKAEFAEWANEWHRERLSLSGLNELNRRNHESKRMHEEAFVVFQYLKQFYHTRDISIELRDGSQNFDAIIYDEGDDLLEYLEVTCVPEENAHLFRRELAAQGQYSMETVLTHNPSLTDYADLVSEAIRKKLAKDYPVPTTLLVVLSSEMIVEEDARFNLVTSRIDPSITAGMFSKIVILDVSGTHYQTILTNAAYADALH